MECNVKDFKYSKDGEFLLVDVPYDDIGSADGTSKIRENVFPGQFFMVKTPVGPYVPRPFSVYDLKDGMLRFLIKSGGEFEHFFENSSKIVIDGPFGNSMPVLENPLLLAGGAGYAPIHFYAMRYEFKEMIVGARSEAFFELVDVPKYSVSTVEPTTVLDVAKFSPLENVIACGPMPMLEKTAEIFKDRNLYLVMEEKMACGKGMCEGCAVMTKSGIKFVCKDGPTFPANEIMDVSARHSAVEENSNEQIEDHDQRR